MADETNFTVQTATATPKLADGVLTIDQVPTDVQGGCRAFMHYNGPTDMLKGLNTGMAVLEPGASPHPPHQHPDEEFMFVTEGTGEIVVAGKTTQVGPGSIMYCAGNVLHGIVNTGKVPMTFYWSKWLT